MEGRTRGAKGIQPSPGERGTSGKGRGRGQFPAVMVGGR